MSYRKKRLIVSLLLVMGCAAACQGRGVDPSALTPWSSPSPPPIPTHAPLTPTPSLTPTITLTPTPSPTPTSTPTATPTGTLTPTITRTPPLLTTSRPKTAPTQVPQNPPPKMPSPGPTENPPTALPTPNYPYTATLSGIGSSTRSIFLKGQQMGKDRHAFTKVGDCEAEAPLFLQPIDLGQYDLGPYGYLRDVIPYFAGSFRHVGFAGKGGFVVASVLNPMFADPTSCLKGETPLACEYRIHQPSIALIMLRAIPSGDNWRQNYNHDLAMVVEYSIQQGVIPVLSTVPFMVGGGADQINEEVRQVAAQYGVPLWDFWVTTEALPGKGVEHTYSHLTEPPDGKATTFTETNLQYGMTRHNLEALEVLHALWTQIMQ